MVGESCNNKKEIEGGGNPRQSNLQSRQGRQRQKLKRIASQSLRHDQWKDFKKERGRGGTRWYVAREGIRDKRKI